MISVQFGIKTTIKNKDVLLKTNNDKPYIEENFENTCMQPVFCHPKFVIETTFRKTDDPNGENNSNFGELYSNELHSDIKEYEHIGLYTKTSPDIIGYRKQVLWDFGDGTQIEGYNAKHVYTRPGRYRISCILFNIDRKGIQNQYYIDVIVKEIIPTMLSFDKKKSSKANILCSKPERIAVVEATLSNTVNEELQICARRIFDKKPKVIENTYADIKEKQFPNLQKYYTFLENQPQFYYNSTEVCVDDLKPVTEFTPKYENIEGEFVIDENNKIGIKLYKYCKFKLDETPEYMYILDPNCNIVRNEVWKEIQINRYYNKNDLGEDCTFLGKRALVDIFYKSDYISAKTKVSMFFNVENQNYDRLLSTATNYTNIPPIGLNFAVLPNRVTDIKCCVTLNGFIHKDENTSWEDFNKQKIDEYCKHSFYKNEKVPCILIPYIELKSDEIKSNQNEYYIPKDVSMIVKFKNIQSEVEGENSIITLLHSKINNMRYLRYFMIDLKDYINASITVNGAGNQKIIYLNKDFSENSEPLYLLNLNEDIEVPKEKIYEQNINELLECYFPHPMFKDANKMKSFFSAILSNNGVLDNIMTRSEHFVDDTVNFKTSYIHNLISMLASLNEDVSAYEYSNFTNVYELRDFTRLLSMNYSDLVGNIYSKQYDLYVDDSYKGANLGRKIRINDILTVDGYGSVVTTKQQEEKQIEEFWQLVVVDDHTKEARVIDFSSYCISEYTKGNMSTDKRFEIEIGKDYKESWAWNLLLPAQYKYMFADDVELSEEQIEEKRNVINNYYTFYIFNPGVSKKYINNFIRENDIIKGGMSEDEFHKQWLSQWELPYHSLYKIINESLKLKNIGADDENVDEKFFDNVLHTISFSMNFKSEKTLNLINDVITKYIYCSESDIEDIIKNDIKTNFDGVVKISWGDGSTTEKKIGDNSDLRSVFSHYYTKDGEYLITVTLSNNIWFNRLEYNYKLIAEAENEDKSIDNRVYLLAEESEDDNKPLVVYTLTNR